MTTTTKEKPSAAASEPSVVDRVMQDLESVHQAAEEILWQIQPGEMPNAKQREILRLVGIVTRHDLDREVGRVGAVKQWLAKAGSQADLVVAEKAAAAAAKAEMEQRPALEEMFASIKAQIAELVGARKSTVAALGKLTRAREALRELLLLPAHVRAAFEADAHVAGQTHRARISELETRLSVIDGLEQIDMNTVAGRRAAELHCESAAPDLFRHEESAPIVRRNPDGSVLDSRAQFKVTFSIDGFLDYRKGVVSKRPAIETERHELRELRDAAIAKVRKLLEHYTDRIA